MPALSPLVTAALLAVAAIAATYLHWVRRPLRVSPGAPNLTSLGWYGIGVVLGPALGLLDRRLLEAGAPALLLAAGWIAARAGSQAPMPSEPMPGATAPALADAVAGWLIPAGLLYAAARFLPTSLAPGWEPRLPVIAVLAAGVAVASGAARRFTTLVALCALIGALFAPLPHGKVLGLPRQAVWLGVAAAGVLLTVVLWKWMTRRAAGPLGGAVTGLTLGAGLGLATGASPVVVCALAGGAVARRSPPGTGLDDQLTRSEAPAAAMLWVAAGAQAGGLLAALASAAVALSLWPIARRLLARTASPPDSVLGLTLVLGYTWTARPASPEALVTATAIALLLTGAIPPRTRPAPPRLTSRLAPAEVSA